MGFHGSDDQRKMTPFQRQVLQAERKRRAEAKEEQRQQAMNGQGNQRPVNSRGPASGSQSGSSEAETVRYINESENPDYDFD